MVKDFRIIKETEINKLTSKRELQEQTNLSNNNKNNNLSSSSENSISKDNYSESLNTSSSCLVSENSNSHNLNSKEESLNCSNSNVEKKKEKTMPRKKKEEKEFLDFILDLKSKVKLKSKVTITKEGPQLFKGIRDVETLKEAYIAHQMDKKGYAHRITAFMLDYN